MKTDTEEMKKIGQFAPLSESQTHNRRRAFLRRRKCFLAVLCALIIVVLLIVLYFVLHTTHEASHRHHVPLTYAEYVGRSMLFKDIPNAPKWYSSDELLYLKENRAMVLNTTSFREEVLFTVADLEGIKCAYIANIMSSSGLDSKQHYIIEDTVVVPSSTRFLVPFNFTHIPGGRKRYLVSFVAYDYKSKKHVFITNPDVFQVPDAYPRFRVALPSPNGRSLVYSLLGSLYYMEDPFQSPGNISKLIMSPEAGKEDTVSIGLCDWLYEEDVLMTTDALWWSTAGSYLLFMHLDDSNVSQIRFPVYGPPSQIFINVQSYRYPLAGDGRLQGNPKLTLYVYSVTSGQVDLVPPPATLQGTEFYLLSAIWYNDDAFVVEFQTRTFSMAYLMLYSMKARSWTQLYRYEPSNGWSILHLDSADKSSLLMAPDQQRIFFIAPDHRAPSENFHVAMVREDGTDLQWIHTADWAYDVSALLRVTQDDIFYTAYYPDVTYQHQFRHSLRTGLNVCLTCETLCDTNALFLSPNGRIAMHNCLGFGFPYSSLAEISADTGKVHTLKILQNNTDEFLKLFGQAPYPTFEYRKVTIRQGTEHELSVQTRVTYPANFSPHNTAKYPLILHVYGGPGSLQVERHYPQSLGIFLSGHLNSIVLEIDGRGTYGRGRQFLVSLQYQAGVVDAMDQIDTLKEFLKTANYIDTKKIAVDGWSYGGFLSGHILANEPLVSCGVLGAPVTDFRYYDTAYTEKFLGRVFQHEDAYERTSLIRKAHMFRNKTMMLVHGTADDNVRFLNSMQLADALIRFDVDFKFLVYKDESHSPHFNFYRSHLPDFLRRCLSLV